MKISESEFNNIHICREQQNQLFNKYIEHDTENNSSQGGVVVRFCTLPDSIGESNPEPSLTGRL